MNIGRQIKGLRKRLHLTQKEFAARMSRPTDYTYVGKIARGNQYPSVKFLEKLAGAYDVPMSYFSLEESDNQRIEQMIKSRIRNHLLELKRQLWLMIEQELLMNERRERDEESLPLLSLWQLVPAAQGVPDSRILSGVWHESTPG